LSLLVETNFYKSGANIDTSIDKPFDIEATIQAIQGNPELAKQILQLLLSNTVNNIC